MNYITKILLATMTTGLLLMGVTGVMVTTGTQYVYAEPDTPKTDTPEPDTPKTDTPTTGTQVKGGIDKVGGTENTTNFQAFIKTVINILLFLVGMIAVIMIIIGGIRYATSNGDQGTVKAAKDTVLYAVIGLVVAIMAFPIVNFFIDQLINVASQKK